MGQGSDTQGRTGHNVGTQQFFTEKWVGDISLGTFLMLR